MPGLCGIVSDARDARLYIDVFRRVHALSGIELFETSHVSDGCALANFSPLRPQSSYAQPGRVKGSNAILMLEGEIYNYRSLSSRAEHSAHQTLCDTLLGLYLDEGPDFVERLDGEFNIVIFEAASKKVTILNDHLGSNPMYYWRRPSGFLFGSEKKALLAADDGRRDIDPIGLLQPFVHQHNIEDRTFIDGLKRLPPSTRLTFADGRVETCSYAGLAYEEDPPTRASEAIEKWQYLLAAATRKRLLDKDRLIFSLSAGLDSRAIACLIDRDKRPIHARTWGGPESDEVRYATEIARRLNFLHVIENPSDYVLSDGIAKIVWRTEGEIDFLHGLSLYNHKRMKEDGDHVIGGWLGDISSGGHIRPFMLLPMQRQRLVERIFEWYSASGVGLVKSVFASQFLDTYLPIVKESFIRSYDRFLDAPNPTAHELWDLRNRQTRQTVSSMPVDSHLFAKVRPFFDRAYLKLVMSLPVRLRIGQTLYKSIIYNTGSEIRSIPNANTGVRLYRTPMSNSVGYAQAAAAGVTRKVLRRLNARLGRQGAHKTQNDLAFQVRRDERIAQMIREFIESDSFDESIFNKNGILRMLDQHYTGAVDRSVPICILATWAIVLPLFVYGNVESCPSDAEPYDG